MGSRQQWWQLTTCWDQLAEEMKADDPVKSGDNEEVKGCAKHQHARGRESRYLNGSRIMTAVANNEGEAPSFRLEETS